MNESEKMLEIIHKNHKMKQLENRKVEQKQKRNKFLVFGIIAAIVILVAGFMYNEKQISNCMNDGFSESFCRYAGE